MSETATAIETCVLRIPVPERKDINLEDVDIAIHMATFDAFAGYIAALRDYGLDVELAVSSDRGFLTAKATAMAEQAFRPDVKLTVFSPHFPRSGQEAPDAEVLLAEQLEQPA